jgi:hypothetical protein
VVTCSGHRLFIHTPSLSSSLLVGVGCCCLVQEQEGEELVLLAWSYRFIRIGSSIVVDIVIKAKHELLYGGVFRPTGSCVQ